MRPLLSVPIDQKIGLPLTDLELREVFDALPALWPKSWPGRSRRLSS